MASPSIRSRSSGRCRLHDFVLRDGMLSLVVVSALAASPLSIPLERYTLPNGLTVILHEDHSLPTVTVNLWFGVGSADEQKGRTGFAHLFEHLMFMGTRAVPNGGFDTLMEQVGGSNNASTDYDYTNYYETGPSNLLETFLWLEADRLAHLPDEMTKAKVDLQRDVVKNERRQTAENQPYGVLELLVDEKLFPAGHPYAHPVIGSHADLTAASVADVKAFFKKFYVPANASLVIAGDFDAATAKQLVAKTLGTLPRVEAPPRVTLPLIELSKPVRASAEDAVQESQVTFVYLAPPMRTPGAPESEVLALVLGGSQTSRLVKHLVVEQQLCERVETSFERRRGQSLFFITATAQGGHRAAELEQALEKELSAFFADPPAAAEISRAQARIQTQLLQSMESPFGVANLLNEAQLFVGDPGDVERNLLAQYDAVTPSGVFETARRVLQRPHLTVVITPKKGGAK